MMLLSTGCLAKLGIGQPATANTETGTKAVNGAGPAGAAEKDTVPQGNDLAAASTSQGTPGAPQGGKSGASGEAAAKTQPIKTVDGTQPGTTGGKASTDPLDSLGVIDSNSAEMVFDVIKLDWSKVQERLATIKTRLAEAQPLLAASAVPANLTDGLKQTVEDLEKAVFSGKVQESKILANKITKYTPDIEDLYAMSYPTDVNRLAYLNREIHINVNESDWTAATSNYTEALRLWGDLSLKLDDTYNTDRYNVETTLGILGEALEDKNASNTVINSNKLVAYINIVKQDFKRQARNAL